MSWTNSGTGFTLRVTAPSGTSGDIAVPVASASDQVTLDGQVASGAQPSGGYLTLHGVRAGAHTVTVRPAG